MRTEIRNLLDYPHSPYIGHQLLEVPDYGYSIEDLEGDSFNPDCHPDMTVEELTQQKEEFRARVESEGVYGYVLQRWNPDIGIGWEDVDSCWGFIGSYGAGNEHYIVEEMTSTIKIN